jgi:hypothetical protein
MLRIAFSDDRDFPSGESLSPQDYLRFVQEHIRHTRITAVHAVNPSIRASTADGILIFSESKTPEDLRRSMEGSGFTKEEIDDLLFRPQFVLPDGESWQRDGFLRYEQHLREVADECWQTLTRELPDFIGAMLKEMAIGTADIPFLDAGADFVPRGGSYVLLSRNLLILPMWFAALRRLPRPWNEQQLEGEVLRRFLGAAAIAVKAIWGHTMVGYYTYSHELLESKELLASGRLLPLGLSPLQRLEAELAQRNDLLLCERFIICHELAHVLMRHTELLRSWGPRDSWSRTEQLQRAKQLREAELNADQMALMLLVRLTPAPRAGIVKPDFVFNADEKLVVLIVLLMLFHVMEDPATSSASDAIHPPALTRLKQLARVLIRLTSGSEWEMRFLAEVWPSIEQDMDVLRTLLITVIAQAKPRLISHADVKALR